MVRPLSSPVSWFLLSALLFGVGCGGRSEDDSTESTDADTSNPGSNTSAGDAPDDSSELGECTKGWPPDEAECPWLGSDDLCYATKLDACACVCPRDRRSTCVSGLPGGPDAHTLVSCF